MTILARTLALGLVTASASAQTPPPQPPIFAAQIESVVIDAFVSGRRPDAPRLCAQDFVLTDGGVSQPFDLIPTEELPIRAVLVFDTSGSMKGAKLDSLRAAAWSFLERLRPRDEVALIVFSDEIASLVPLTPDHSQTRGALLRLRAGGGTSAHDALFAALLLPGSAQRTLVILFSDGEDNSSWLGDKQIRSMVERSNALIHVVAASSAPTSGVPVSQSPDFTAALQAGDRERARSGYTPRLGRPDPIHVRKLRELAETTGGSLVEVDSSARLEAAFTQIIEAMKGRYVLRYDPENPKPGWHKLELQIRSGSGKVRGRTGYWVEKR